MKIKVIGKAHLEGTSKQTGKEYNFNQVHYPGFKNGGLVVGLRKLVVYILKRDTL